MKQLSTEHRRKIGVSTSKALQGRTLSDEHKEALKISSQSRKKTNCSNCGKLFSINGVGQHEIACRQRDKLNARTMSNNVDEQHPPSSGESQFK